MTSTSTFYISFYKLTQTSILSHVNPKINYLMAILDLWTMILDQILFEVGLDKVFLQLIILDYITELHKCELLNCFKVNTNIKKTLLVITFDTISAETSFWPLLKMYMIGLRMTWHCHIRARFNNTWDKDNRRTDERTYIHIHMGRQAHTLVLARAHFSMLDDNTVIISKKTMGDLPNFTFCLLTYFKFK
jgi:hypothetical protein